MSDADHSTPAADPSVHDGPAAATTRDKILVVVFWAWAGLLVTAALAQIFGWEGLLDALDVKRWFAK